MSYCSNCGGRLNDNGICPNCGGIIEANIKPVKQEDSDVLKCAKAFFTLSPLKGVEEAARTRSAAVWVTFGCLFAVSAVSMSLAAFGTLSPGFFREICGSRIAAAAEKSAETPISSFIGLTAHAAVMALTLLILQAVITRILFTHAEEKPSINQALNIVAMSLLPLSMVMLLVIPAALVSVPFAILLILVGLTASAVSYYFGIQKASAFNRSPFFTMVCAEMVAAAIITLCSHGLALLFFR